MTSTQAFRHEAMLYPGDSGFVAGAARFIRDSLDACEPILVVVRARKINLLRDELGRDAASVHFADMASVGLNPALIIPAWEDYVAQQGGTGRRFRGVGEPIWPGRDDDALVEAQRHESLLNIAFADAWAWWLLCPYDSQALDPAVLEEAARSHPYVWTEGEHRASEAYDGLQGRLDDPLPEPTVTPVSMRFDATSLGDLRGLVARLAARAGLRAARIADMMMAVNEVATNSVCHAGGTGTARIWPNGEGLCCEIRDGGRIDHPLLDRRRPGADVDGSRGLWLANHLCDLVQVRSTDAGTAVRLHVQPD